MVVKVLQRLKAWSFSRWRDWLKCPAMVKYKHIDKWGVEEGAEDDTPVQARGHDMHTGGESYALKQSKTLPKELKPFAQEFDEIRNSKLKYLAEQQWAFTNSWNPVEWFSASAWCRVIMDLHAVDMAKRICRVIDLKSGRKYPKDHALQMDLYAMAAMIMYPKVHTVVVELWYTDLGEIEKQVYDRDQLQDLKRTWLLRVSPMMQDTHFKVNPGNHCNWCAYSRYKGGPCKAAK